MDSPKITPAECPNCIKGRPDLTKDGIVRCLDHAKECSHNDITIYDGGVIPAIFAHCEECGFNRPVIGSSREAFEYFERHPWKKKEAIVANINRELREISLRIEGVAVNLVGATPDVIMIDRRTSFAPYEENWRLINGEQDQRSLDLIEIDLNQIQLLHMMEAKESAHVQGEKVLSRLKSSGYVRLDAQVLKTLLQNPSRIPASWIERLEWRGEGYDDWSTCICFDGTVFSYPYFWERRYVLGLCREKRGGLHGWGCKIVDLGYHSRDLYNPSAVLVP